MALVRIALERLLVLLFWIARSAFLAFVVATVSTLLAAGVLGGPEAPAWLAVLERSCLSIGGTFLLTTILLFVAPGLRAPAGDESEGAPPWIWLLGLMLIALPALAWASLADFVALWREILVLLDDVGFWDAFARGGQNSGLVMLPIMAALFVPSLEAIAAFFLIGAPLVLLALLPTRSRQFPRLFTMLVVCQAGLVLASGIGADAFAKLAAELTAAIGTPEDVEVGRAAEQLSHASGVLTAAASAFVAPMLGHLVWLPVLLVSPRAAAFFRAGAKPATAPAWSAPPIERPAVQPTPTTPAWPTAARERAQPARPTRPAGARDRNVSFALIALGALMLLFGAGEALRSRTRYVSSDPAPGVTLAAAPAHVRVRFEAALHPGSRLWVDRRAAGEEAIRVGESSGLDPDDAQGTTLRVALTGASSGLYRVSWQALPASGGSARNGSFRFAVGMPLPEPAAGGELEDHVAGERAKRKTVVGGLALLLLGAALPQLSRRP
jgi:methionine-rich copper-binding protein CopC